MACMHLKGACVSLLEIDVEMQHNSISTHTKKIERKCMNTCSTHIEGVVSRRAGEQQLWQGAKEHEQCEAVCPHCPNPLIDLQCRCFANGRSGARARTITRENRLYMEDGSVPLARWGCNLLGEDTMFCFFLPR